MRRIPALLLIAAAACAGDAGPEPVKPGSKPAPKRGLTAMQLIAEEEKWVFRAPLGRPDVLIDLEAKLVAQRTVTKTPGPVRNQVPTPSQNNTTTSDAEQLISWAKAEEERVRNAVTARKFEEAMKAADSALKVLDAHVARPEIAALVVSIRTYRLQAEEAKIRDDAQAAFESLKIQVLGVLWSQDGMRMAIIQGENRALTVNDRVKDCPVINIDQDRVDFRFVFGRRRFEFPVYVDQNLKAKP